MSDHEGIAGLVGEQRTRFIEAYSVEPNRVGLPVNMCDRENFSAEIMGMQVRWLDWPEASVTAWREAGSDHEGMMTRRECLERWAFTDRKAWDNPSFTWYAMEAHLLRAVLGARGVRRHDLAHELALMMDEERGGNGE